MINGDGKVLKICIRFLAVTAGFFLIFRTGHSIKTFDLLIIILGVVIIFESEARQLFKRIWPKIWPYLKYFIALISLIILAQIISNLQNQNTVFDSEIAVNYGRIIFNIYTLFLIAFLIYYDRKILFPLSLSIFLSSFVNLPAYWKVEERAYLYGGRLTGSLQSPLILGLWMTIAFLIGLGLFMTAKKLWVKTLMAILLAVTASFLLWTASRAAWLSLAFALLLWMLFYLQKKDWKKIGNFTLVLVISFFFGYLMLPSGQLHVKSSVRDRATNFAHSVVTLQPSTVESQSHIRLWPGVADFVIQHPLGSGFGYYAKEQLILKIGDTISTNSFLELGLYGGIGAIGLFLVILFKLGKKALYIITKTAKLNFPELKLAWLLSGVALIADIFFTDAFLWRHVWFILGMVLGVILLEHNRLTTQINHSGTTTELA